MLDGVLFTQPSREEKDFIRNNAVHARAYPSKCKQNQEENPLEREGYGQIPKYLQKRKQAWERENARRALYENDPECPPGKSMPIYGLVLVPRYPLLCSACRNDTHV